MKPLVTYINGFTVGARKLCLQLLGFTLIGMDAFLMQKFYLSVFFTGLKCLHFCL